MSQPPGIGPSSCHLRPPSDYRRHGAITDLAADPFGRLWVTTMLCGGAGCDADALYYVRDGVWTLLPEEAEDYYVLELRAVTDAAGTAWLFGGFIYRLTETDIRPAVGLLPVSVAADADGRIWFIVHGFPQGMLCAVDAEARE